MTAPDQLSIETPEQVALEFPLAGVGSRFLAVAVDTLLQAAIGMVVFLVAVGVFTALRAGGLWIAAFALIAGFLIFYGYFAAFEALWHGQTPGKRLVGLRVLSVSGRPIRIDEALLRNVLRLVDQLPGVYAVGIVSMLVTARSQRLGDLAAGTVVHEKGLTAPVFTVAEAPVPSWTGGAGLSDAELLLVETFLQRRRELDLAVREDRARAIADRLRVRLGPSAPDLEPEALIEALHARARTRGGRA